MLLNTSIVLRKTFFYTGSFIILTSGFLGFLFTKVYPNNIIAGIALFVLLGCIVGIIFCGKYIIKKLAVRSFQIKIDESSISFIKNPANVPYIIQVSIKDILWYSMEIINPKFYDLKVKLTSGKKLSFSFPQDLSEPADNDSLEILEVINAKIAEFNKQNELNMIELKPAFAASFAGKVVLLVLIFLTVFTYIFVVNTVKSSFLGLFFAVSAIIQLYIRRKNNIDFYNKMYKANQLLGN
jgi:hypothetical protein